MNEKRHLDLDRRKGGSYHKCIPSYSVQQQINTHLAQFPEFLTISTVPFSLEKHLQHLLFYILHKSNHTEI